MLYGLLDSAVQKVAQMTATASRTPNGPAMSALARPELLNFAMTLLPVRRSRLRLYEQGDEWVRVGLKGTVIRPRLRMRPPTAHLVEPGLFDEQTLTGPAGSFVLMWDWDQSLGGLNTFALTRVVTMKRWGLDCPLLEDIPLEAPLAGSSADPFRHLVPMGIGNDDDDLSDLVVRWEDEEDEARSEPEVSDRREEDERDGEGDTAVGEDD
jgi:hypothetical protein